MLTDESIYGNRGEEQCQVDVREPEHPHRGRRRTQQAQRGTDESEAENNSRQQVQQSRTGGRLDQQRRPDGDERVQADLYRGGTFSGDDREHWYAGGLVIGPEMQGQRPEVGRCPVEDHGKQEPRRKSDVPGDCGPSNQCRHGSGGATDDDVLRRDPLQIDGVDEHIEAERSRGQQRRLDVRRHPQNDKPRRSERDAQDQCLTGRGRFRRQRPVSGAAHPGIDIAVDHIIDCVGTSGGECTTSDRSGHEAQAGPATLGENHCRDRCDQQQLDDSRLGQCHVGLDHVERRSGRFGRRHHDTTRSDSTRDWVATSTKLIHTTSAIKRCSTCIQMGASRAMLTTPTITWM